ncbi:ATP-dependent Clp protease proteolytic subunit, partial [Rhodovulum adriaticum]|nr:ATP-dependent Clp protease proteolytic subunit [Rhodovulum adriaticum]
ISIVAEQILKIRERLNKIISEKSGQDIEQIKIDTERDKYMTAQEALEYGLIDRVIDSHKEI